MATNHSNPYITLPQYTVTYGKLFTWKKNIILEDSKRTLEEHADILAPFEKLAHPNGLCLKGYWDIHTANPYSGYFKQGCKALIIVRASSALSNTHSGEIRSFGFAGTDALHYTDVTLTNEPSVTTTSALVKNLLYGMKVASAFAKADTHSGIRQLYEVSERGKRKIRILSPLRG